MSLARRATRGALTEWPRLVSSTATFARSRTNVLLGSVLLVVFISYIMLIFQR